MDGHRFDSLTRKLTTTATVKTSRRGSLRFLAAAGVMLAAITRGKGKAAAQDWYRTAGEPCWDDEQCVAADAPLVCAENGFDYDGELNCCTYEGSRCGADEHCCGFNVCASGFCRALAGGANITYTTGATNLSPGDPCQNTTQCNRAQTGAICEFTSSTQDSRCCWYEGSFCSSGAQCCGSRICAGGVCQFPGGSSIGSCTPERSQCNGDWECCGDLVCGNGICRALAGGSGAGCTSEGCTCMLYREARCRASCQLNDPCDAGLTCTARTSEDIGICVRR